MGKLLPASITALLAVLPRGRFADGRDASLAATAPCPPGVGNYTSVSGKTALLARPDAALAGLSSFWVRIGKPLAADPTAVTWRGARCGRRPAGNDDAWLLPSLDGNSGPIGRSSPASSVLAHPRGFGPFGHGAKQLRSPSEFPTGGSAAQSISIKGARDFTAVRARGGARRAEAYLDGPYGVLHRGRPPRGRRLRLSWSAASASRRR